MRTRMSAVVVLAAALGGAASAEDKAVPFGVKVTGTGAPMILIPGLGCDGATWDTTVAHFRGRYECHVLTPAGFAGQPPVEGPFFDTMSAGLARYVRDKKLTKPVLVGHSIAAALVLRAAADHPDLYGPVVAVDGFPCIFALIDPATTPAAMAKAGAAERAKGERASRDEFLKGQKAMFGQWLSGEKLDTAMTWQAASDQGTLARAKGELFALDLRPALAKVTTPILMLAGYDKGYERFGVTRAVFGERIKAQFTTAKAARVAIRDDCKHFIMYDQPDWMWGEMTTFLK